MKKVLTIFLIITLCLPAVFLSVGKSAHAETDISPNRISLGDGVGYNSCDVSYKGNDIIFLANGSTETPAAPQIVNRNGEIIGLNGDVNYNYLCGYNNEYFYATNTDIYLFDGIVHKKVNSRGQFINITDLIVSSKSLFLIDNISSIETLIYIYNNDSENPNFDYFTEYSYEVKKFAYSEVSNNSFIYDGENIIIEGKNNLVITKNDITVTEMLCDFEGNLFVFESSDTSDKILRYSYESDYTYSESYPLKFTDYMNTREFISAAFNQETGEFALLRSYKPTGVDLIIGLYKISRDNQSGLNKLQAKTSNDIPEFEGLELAELNKLNNLNFYAAEIKGYPSNRLYPADVITDGTTIKAGGPESIKEIEIGEKVLVFNTAGKFSYILYKDKFAVVYNNSLVKVSDKSPEFNTAKVLQYRSKIFSCPSNFVYEQKLKYSFLKEELTKDEIVKVISEIEFYKTTYCKINYGNNFEKTGYINKAEISEQYEIKTFNPRPGRIDSNKDIPLYSSNDILSEKLFMLSHKQDIQILESGSEFCYISVTINGKAEMGYVETQFVLESGLTKLQKIGLWIFITAVLLLIIAIVLRVVIVRRKGKLK